jgi:GntR family transcriptional repressor for pyruvate dehydrogenase complex
MILVRLSDHVLYEPVSRQKTYEIVAERLLALISSRRLGPGDALPSERELVQLYRVGRSSVREALRMLESKGVIKSGGNGSFTVAEFGNALNNSLDFLLSVDAANSAELYSGRPTRAGAAAALAASRRDEDDLGRIGAEIEAMEAGLDSEDGFITADLRFHLTIAEASGNRLIAHLMEAIRTLLQRSLSSAYHIPGSPEGAVVLHGLILDAISTGHPEEARQRMQEHVSRVERDITGAGR